VPDRVLTPLIAAVETDPFFAAFQTVREEQAVGIVAGAWRGGMHGIVLMQTFGVATLPNALACACQIPLPSASGGLSSNPTGAWREANSTFSVGRRRCACSLSGPGFWTGAAVPWPCAVRLRHHPALDGQHHGFRARGQAVRLRTEGTERSANVPIGPDTPYGCVVATRAPGLPCMP
jgi:hypothetical protein